MKTITMSADVAEYVRDLVNRERDRAQRAAVRTQSKTVRRARLVEVELANAFLVMAEEPAAVTHGGPGTAGPVDSGLTQAPFELHNTAGGASLTGDTP